MSEVWQRLLRTPNRFVAIDSSAFLDPAITSHEYGLRYAADVAHTEIELLALTGDSESHFADQLFVDFGGGVEFAGEDGVSLLMGYEHDEMSYPFRLKELRDLARRMEAAEDERQTR